MKKILFTLPVILMITFSIALIPKRDKPVLTTSQAMIMLEKKSKYSKEQLAFIQQVGLTSSSTYMNNYTLYYSNEKKHGMKYFTSSDIEFFCKKYNLVMGELKDYLYEIPSKNIDEFKKNKDFYYSLGENKQCFFLRTCRDCGRQFLSNIDTSEMQINPTDGDEWASICLKKDAYKKYCKEFKGKISDVSKLVVEWRRSEWLPQMRIVAPVEYFTKDAVTSKDGKIIVKNPDPIIIAQCEGGWIVLTEWEF